MFIFGFDKSNLIFRIYVLLKSEENWNPVEMIFTLILLYASVMAILFFCEFGEMVGSAVDAFDAELCQCDWYEFPIEMQKLLATFMLSTQRSTVFRGYGDIPCNRNYFKKVKIQFF